MDVSSLAWFNGSLTDREAGAPSIASINFHLGTSVFDGLMAYWNGDHYYLHCATEHLERFRAGAATMGLTFEWSARDMLLGIEALLAREPQATQYVRPIAYRRAPELWVTGAEDRPVDVCIFTVPVQRDIDRPISCQLSPIERISSRSIPQQIKVSGSYVNSHYARRTAERAGFDDGLMLDRQGRVAEASAANVFFVEDGRLRTPKLNEDVFPGVTRRVIIDLARSAGVSVSEDDLTQDDLSRCDAAFLCSTLMEIRGVSRLAERTLSTADNAVYRKMVTAFRALTHQ